MSEPVAARPRLTPRRVAIAALLSAALAIAITFWLSNAGDSKAAPCAPQSDAAEKPVTLADFAGKTLLVNFWASWCVPCRAEMPALDRLAAAENDADFMVLPINLDLGSGGRDKARAFLDEGNWANLPLYADSSFEAFKQLQTSGVALGLPSTLLIDKKGCEIGVLQGPAEWDSPDGINVIEALKSL